MPKQSQPVHSSSESLYLICNQGLRNALSVSSFYATRSVEPHKQVVAWIDWNLPRRVSESDFHDLRGPRRRVFAEGIASEKGGYPRVI